MKILEMKLSTFLFFLIFCLNLFAQPKWDQISIPGSATIEHVYSFEDRIFVHGETDNIYAEWNAENASWDIIDLPADEFAYKRKFYTDGDWHYIIAENALWRATSGMDAWDQLKPNTTSNLAVRACFVTEDVMLATHPNAIYISTDQGTTWAKTLDVSGQVGGKIFFHEDKGVFYINYGNFMFKSNDRGQSWLPLPSMYQAFLAFSQTYQIAAQKNSVRISNDGFINYESYSNAFSVIDDDGALVFHRDTLFYYKIQSGKPLFWYSTDLGKNWKNLISDYPDLLEFPDSFFDIKYIDGKWYLASTTGVYSIASEDKFAIRYTANLGSPNIQKIITTNSKIWMQKRGVWFYLDKKEKKTWHCVDGNLPDAAGSCNSSLINLIIKLGDGLLNIDYFNHTMRTGSVDMGWNSIEFPAGTDFESYYHIGQTEHFYWLYSENGALFRIGEGQTTLEKVEYPFGFEFNSNQYFEAENKYLLFVDTVKTYVTFDEGLTWGDVPEYNCPRVNIYNNKFVFQKNGNQKIWSCYKISPDLYFELDDLPVIPYSPQSLETGAPLEIDWNWTLQKSDNRMWWIDKINSELYFSDDILTQFYNIKPKMPFVPTNALSADESGIYVGSNVGIWHYSPFYDKKERDKKEVLIYPNPCRNEITMQFAKPFLHTKVEVEIIHSSGAIIQKKEVDLGYLKTLDVSNLMAGFYIIRVKSKGEFCTGSFIKQ